MLQWPERVEGGLAETLRLNITLTSLRLGENGQGGAKGGRTLAETLCLNTTLTSPPEVYVLAWEWSKTLSGLGIGEGV